MSYVPSSKQTKPITQFLNCSPRIQDTYVDWAKQKSYTYIWDCDIISYRLSTHSLCQFITPKYTQCNSINTTEHFRSIATRVLKYCNSEIIGSFFVCFYVRSAKSIPVPHSISFTLCQRITMMNTAFPFVGIVNFSGCIYVDF